MKRIRLVLVTISTIMILSILGTYQTQSASAKSKSITTFPKSMRGTWYKYDKKMHLTKFIIKKHSFDEIDFANAKHKYRQSYKLKKPLTKKQYKEANKGVEDGQLGHSHTKAYKLAINAIKSIQGSYLQKHKQKWLFIVQRYIQGGLKHNYLLRINKTHGHSELLVMPRWPYHLPTLHFKKNQQLAKYKS